MSSPESVSEKIVRYFGTQPRNGSARGAHWHRRGKIETRLSQLLLTRSQNICIDGPTGSGKSSVAITVLSKVSQPYVWVPIANNMSWPDLCEDIVTQILDARYNLQKSRKTTSVKVDTKKPLSIDEFTNPLNLLSRFSLRGEDAADEIVKIRHISRTWTIADLEEFLQTNQLCLLIDDFEKAHPDLTLAIADLCKRLTIKSNPKCVIIGTGETFARLYRADEGLDGRLAELTVASFGTPTEVWNYLNDGFDLLGFDNPRQLFKSKLITKSEADGVERAFYEAADGLPKYINELGMRICYRVLGEQNIKPIGARVSTKDAMAEATEMLTENVSRCTNQIRKIEKELRESLEIRLVLKAIFDLGANGVHRVIDLVTCIERRIDPAFTYDQVIAGLDRLKKLGLYVQTGKSGEVIFAKEPMFAHVLGLICNDPDRFGRDNSVFGLQGQRSLPLV